MKKTLILLLLVSFCGGTDLSELEKDILQTEERIEDLESKDALTLEEEQELENLREQFEELEGTEAVEEIVVLETQKKEENSGISEEDFDEYIAGLEDYGAGGSFVPIPLKPTVFADVKNNMEIAKTEIFGPVLSVIPFESEEEAISIANDTPYGLTNYIQTQDPEKVKRVARKLRSGMVDVNGAGIAVDAPFGGFKHSGIGREAGQEGLTEFLEVKSVGGWN